MNSIVPLIFYTYVYLLNDPCINVHVKMILVHALYDFLLFVLVLVILSMKMMLMTMLMMIMMLIMKIKV